MAIFVCSGTLGFACGPPISRSSPLAGTGLNVLGGASGLLVCVLLCLCSKGFHHKGSGGIA